MISFVIPQKGRLDLFELTLLSIAKQDIVGSSEPGTVSIEVVAITQDDDPDAAHDILTRLFGQNDLIDFQFLVAANEASTIASLRNRAARASRGSLLAFLDADISLSSDWAVSMTKELLLHDKRALVSAMQVLGSSPSLVERIQVELNHLRVNTVVSVLSGHNLLLRRETFESVGGFPEHLVTCEDSVFTDKVSKLGYLYRSSQASYVHLGEDRDFMEVFRKEQWRSHSNFATLYGREVRLVELISFVAPIFVVALLVFTVIAAVAGTITLSFSFFLIALIPVFLYSARLLLKSKWRLSVLKVFGYYSTYFVARGIGMIRGLGSALRLRSKLKETI